MLKDVHERMCGSHSSPILIVHKVIKLFFIGPLVLKKATMLLKPILVDIPFTQFGLYVVGLISPILSKGHPYILVILLSAKMTLLRPSVDIHYVDTQKDN